MRYPYLELTLVMLILGIDGAWLALCGRRGEIDRVIGWILLANAFAVAMTILARII